MKYIQPTILVYRMLHLSIPKKIEYIIKHQTNREFMELIYLGVHSSIDFRMSLDPPELAKELPIDNHKTFYKLSLDSITNIFDESKRQALKEFVESCDSLSRYIYTKIINKDLGVNRNDLEGKVVGIFDKEKYEITSKFGSPKFPCIIQVFNSGIEAIVTVTSSGAILKNKTGTPIGGFEKHLEDFTKLNLYGDFNVILSGMNEDIYYGQAKGIRIAEATDPIYILDYQQPMNLSNRLIEIESALIDKELTYIKLVTSLYVEDKLPSLSGRFNADTAIARQDTLPIIRVAGDHNIDVSYILKGD